MKTPGLPVPTDPCVPPWSGVFSEWLQHMLGADCPGDGSVLLPSRNVPAGPSP